ncbi:MAG: hypothetical protein JJ992_29450, partial [Planctomycetes bacterium]|nr:hypothetical protein [Planctomycetota bacterium]
MNDYLDDALQIAREGLDFVDNLESAQTQKISHNGASGTVTLQFENDPDTFSFAFNATADDLKTAIEGLPSVANRSVPVTVQVTGTGTSDDPWVIRFQGPQHGEDVPALTLVSNDMLDAAGAAADVQLIAPADIAGDLRSVESFLKNALDIQETQIQTISYDAVSGDLTLHFDGDAEAFTISYDATPTDIVQALEGLSSIDTGDVEVSGAGTLSEPWVIRFAGTKAGEGVPDLVIDTNTLLAADGTTASVTVAPDRLEHVDLLLEGNVIVLDVGMNIAFDGNENFRFSLDQLAEQLDDGNPFKALLTGASDLLDINASGDVVVQVDGRLNLTVGFDPNATVGTAIFVRDSSELLLDVYLDGQDLNFDLNLNIDDALSDLKDLFPDNTLTDVLGDLLKGTGLDTVGITVKDGSVQLNSGVDNDGDGQLDPARFHFLFAADDTVVDGQDGSGDGRYSVFIDTGSSNDQLSDGLITAHTGTLTVDLPLYFPTADLPMGGSTEDRDGNGLADNVLYVEISDLNNFRTSLDVATPDIKNSIGLFSLLNNIDIVTVIAGTGDAADEASNPLHAGILGNLEDLFRGEIFGIHLPFIGDSLKDAANFIGGFRTDIRQALDSLAAPGDEMVTVIDIVQGGLFEIFGPRDADTNPIGLGLLTDANQDGTIDRNDILVSGDTRHVQFDVRLH